MVPFGSGQSAPHRRQRTRGLRLSPGDSVVAVSHAEFTSVMRIEPVTGLRVEDESEIVRGAATVRSRTLRQTGLAHAWRCISPH